TAANTRICLSVTLRIHKKSLSTCQLYLTGPNTNQDRGSRLHRDHIPFIPWEPRMRVLDDSKRAKTGAARYRPGVLKYAQMGYWNPDYSPAPTDVLALF